VTVETVGDDLAAILSPPTEIVVYVDGRDPGAAAAPFQSSEGPGHGKGALEHPLSAFEFHVVDDVDDDQDDRARLVAPRFCMSRSGLMCEASEQGVCRVPLLTGTGDSEVPATRSKRRAR
jgi:hypothetical protein